MKKWLIYAMVALMLVSLVVWAGVKDALQPVTREVIQSPIFTLGDATYQTALKADKQVLKFGPLFWGAYPGGLAFEDAAQAAQYLQEHRDEFGAVSSGWHVYQLAGDFEQDTYLIGEQHYLAHSLLITQLVD